jgi:hypothetical protein
MHLARFGDESSLFYLILGWGIEYPGEEIYLRIAVFEDKIISTWKDE